jgi:hypothetical protein
LPEGNFHSQEALIGFPCVSACSSSGQSFSFSLFVYVLLPTGARRRLRLDPFTKPKYLSESAHSVVVLVRPIISFEWATHAALLFQDKTSLDLIITEALNEPTHAPSPDLTSLHEIYLTRRRGLVSIYSISRNIERKLIPDKPMQHVSDGNEPCRCDFNISRAPSAPKEEQKIY